MTEYTEQEKQTIRTGVFGAVALVSNAEPGMFDMFKEGVAGAKALKETSPELRDVLKAGCRIFPRVRRNSSRLCWPTWRSRQGYCRRRIRPR